MTDQRLRPAQHVKRTVDVEKLLVWADSEQDALHRRAEGLYAAEAITDGLPVQGISQDGCAVVKRIGPTACAVEIWGITVMANLDPDAKDESHLTLLRQGGWEITYVTFRDMGIAFAVGLPAIYPLLVGSSAASWCRCW